MTVAGNHLGRDGAAAVAVETFLNFVKLVIDPLKEAIESCNIENRQFRRTLEDMRDLLTYLEMKSEALAENGNRDTGREVKTATEATFAEGHPIAPLDGGSSPADEWTSFARRLAPRERSLAREIEILRTLQERQGAIPLRQLHGRLSALGLLENGGQAIVVTQISRLKKLGLVSSESQGFYARTDLGMEKLQRLRVNHAALFASENVREIVEGRL